MITEEQLHRAKILIIDDNQANVLLLEKILKKDGYININSLTDSRQAKKVYQDLRPDLLLLDLKMPNLDGFGVMEQLKEIDPDSYLPVLVVTALQDSEILREALQKGAKDFISKPLDKTEVLIRIHNLLEVRLLHGQVKNQNALLEQKVRERTRELNDTRLEIIRRLGRAAEYRDNETGFHIIRMSKICSMLGAAASLGSYQCDMLLNASPMHDIGKIGIPDRILLKPGSLNDDEWKIMKKHTTIGAEILSEDKSELLRISRTIALTHHEKWDGSGYPRGLKGKDIPLEGRICALADVFDALTSDRVYKKALSVKEAMTIINCQVGIHFDPRLVELLKDIMSKITIIKKTYAEPARK